MKKSSLFFIGLLLIPTLFLTSCDRGDDPADGIVGITTPKFTLMKEYMVANDLDIGQIDTNSFGKFVVGAPAAATDVDTFLEGYYIMDIRSSSDFLAAHVNGAINVPFSNILTEAPNAGTKPILMVCYTGQTACYGTALLRMYGYPKTQALKWGMSGWNSTTAKAWNDAIAGNPAVNSSNWSYAAAPANVNYGDPKITTSLTDGEAILKERVEAVVADGFQSIAGTSVLDNPGNYFINNYFNETDYLGFGHINGAYRILPFTLEDDSYLSLNPDAETLVTYCYTGQTSAVISATLNVLGYNAKSLLFGMNGLYNTNPEWGTSVNQWKATKSKNYDIFSN